MSGVGDQSSWVTAVATVALAAVTLLYVRKLDEAHEREIEPHLQWQDPRRSVLVEGEGIADFSVVVTNVGRGHARLTAASVTSNLGRVLTIEDLRLPSNLAPGVPYTFHFHHPEYVTAFVQGLSELRISFDYTDVESRHCYRTEVAVAATQAIGGAAAGPIDFLSLDERPARRRRVRCGPSAWSRIRSRLPGGTK